MALLMFALTLFVSAFILFLVQPIIGKMILPRLGGTPQVWNTCMVFFQAVLLAGYAYTHWASTRLPLRKQLILHCIFLLIPLIILLPTPLIPGAPFDVSGFKPLGGANPIPQTLGLLLMVVGLPFLAVSTSAPLLQKWFASTGHPAGKDPYFLYGASNFGSMLALLAYPFALEWILPLRGQAWTFTVGYVILVCLIAACAVMVWKVPPTVKLPQPGPSAMPASEAALAPPPSPDITAKQPPPGSPPAPNVPKSTGIKKDPKPGPKASPHLRRDHETPSIQKSADDMTPWRQLRWIGLAAVPSSLMLGVTTHITTDLSPIPLFWLIPLALYLLSFILVFSRWPVVWTKEPHTAVLYLHPVALAAMIFLEITNPSGLAIPIIANVVGFFATAMACHGELAKDRPGVKHLTEFYLWMSVGGVVGGIFNALIAPLMFTRVYEFNVAVVAACLFRPILSQYGWTDQLVAGFMGQPSGRGKHEGGTENQVPWFMDVVLPLGVLLLVFLLVFVFDGMIQSLAVSVSQKGEALGLILFFTYFLPLLICCFFMNRPLRLGLAIGAVIGVHAIQQSSRDRSIFEDRSYYGIIKVKQSYEEQVMPDGKRKLYPFYQLVHGHINHGMNFHKPDDKKLWGNPQEDFSRLATTYYHRLGPVGIVMEKFNWNSEGGENTYHADGRMPTSLIGFGAPPLGMGLPMEQLVGLWSEPPIATIGLGTGTMASYGRPFQHVHFYEIDNHVRRLSLPPENRRMYFNYLQEAKDRGCEVQVLMGDARLRMDEKYGPYDEEKEKKGKGLGGGPDNFYHMMVVDAFSSDAIPVHLLTVEAFELYFQKLTEEGVLCVHTSNRYVDLPLVVADVATFGIRTDLKDPNGKRVPLAFRRGHDVAPGHDARGASISERGHYTSEWVMVARKDAYLSHLKEPPGYRQKFGNRPFEEYWTIPRATGKHIWTDNFSNLWRVLK